MGRKPKVGLDYFPKDVDYYDDFKIMDLLNEYGPLGQTIYDIIVSTVYHHGYYLEIPIDKLANKIVRIIGNRWVKDKNLVLQVILYCADIGLLHKDLLTQSVVTSAGIQTRYSEVTVRNKVIKDKYWLLEKDKPLLNLPKNSISVTETSISVTEKEINVTDMPLKESKVNKSKLNKEREEMALPDSYFDNQELDTSFKLFIDCRSHKFNEKISLEQIRLMIEELNEIATNDSEKIIILKKAIMKGWKSFYPLDKGKGTNKPDSNKFNNFKQRDYDYEDLEKQLLGANKRNN